MTNLVFIPTQSVINESDVRIDPATGVRYVDVDVTTADLHVDDSAVGSVQNLDAILPVPYPLRVQRLILDEIQDVDHAQELISSCQPRALSMQHCPGLILRHVPDSVQHLDLSENHGLFIASHMTTIIHCLPNLRHLCLEHCELSKESCLVLATAISQATHLRHLNLAGNSIGDSGIEALGFGLKHSRSIEELIVAECNISQTGAISLATQLPELDNLRVLDLELNPLNTEGVHAIVQALVQCQCLQRINLAQCGCRDVHHLLTSCTNQTLLEVDVDNTPDAREVIRAITARNLASTVSRMRSLFLGSKIVRRFTSNVTFDRSLLHEIFSMCPPVRIFPKRKHST